MQKINYQTYKKPSDFMKFDQGENPIRIVTDGFIGKVHKHKMGDKWLNLGICKQPAPCQLCQSGNKPKLSYRWVVLDLKTDEAKLLEAGPQLGDQICLLGKTVDLTTVDLLIPRSGVGRQTKYGEPRVLKSEPISEEVRKKHRTTVQYLKKTYIEEPA